MIFCKWFSKDLLILHFRFSPPPLSQLASLTNYKQLAPLLPAVREPLEAGSGDGGGGKGVGRELFRQKDYCQHLHREGGGEGILAFTPQFAFESIRGRVVGTLSYRRRIMLKLPNLHWYSPKEEVQEKWNKTELWHLQTLKPLPQEEGGLPS